MYAIIKTGGKQYTVAVGDKVKVETLPGDVGSQIKLVEDVYKRQAFYEVDFFTTPV